MTNSRTRSTLALLALASGLAIGEPDLIVSDIPSATSFGFVDGTMAYSFGTTLCNVGDTELTWNESLHPIVSQTLYRLADGQLHQIGVGFAHHPTPPLSGNACGLGCTPAGINALGAGCSTTSSSFIHGLQETLGPRLEVDPFTGFFPFPYTSIGQAGDAIYKRVQVELSDISDPNALYFVETQVISESETMPLSRTNNTSYRQVLFTPGTGTVSMTGPTYAQQPAIFAWRDHGFGIGMPDASVLISQASIPSDGVIHVGSKATELGNGDWRYDLAIHNQNAASNPSWIEHSIGAAADAHGFVFAGVDQHDDVDGDIDDAQWVREELMCGTSIEWSAEGFISDPLANSIRWGTTYGFSFVTTSAPASSAVDAIDVGFAPANGGPITLDAITPEGIGSSCVVDFNGDGDLNFFDISAFLDLYANQNAGADLNDDGLFNFFDVSAFLNQFNEGCCF